MRKRTPPPRWDALALTGMANHWLQEKKAENRGFGECSPWWPFISRFPDKVQQYVQDLVAGTYRFAPLKKYYFPEETITLWEWPDRLALSLLLEIIKPTFAHILSPKCFHMQGPNGSKPALRLTEKALKTGKYRYIIRADIRSYYASISRAILVQQIKAFFKDPRLIRYLEHIITSALDDDAVLFLPTEGIPIRSSLSPFFGALYLTPLDRIFENRTGIFYLRYMDDIVILAQTKRQFVAAKKRLQQQLVGLKLTLSRKKTKMGLLGHFHFLGTQFSTSRNALGKIQVSVQIHNRSCRRALDKASAMKADGASPQKVQHYIDRWATWWECALKGELHKQANLHAWVNYCRRQPEPLKKLEWLGRGLLEWFKPSVWCWRGMFA